MQQLRSDLVGEVDQNNYHHNQLQNMIRELSTDVQQRLRHEGLIRELQEQCDRMAEQINNLINTHHLHRGDGRFMNTSDDEYFISSEQTDVVRHEIRGHRTTQETPSAIRSRSP